MGRVQLPQWRPHILPPFLAEVRANCNRMGLPVPVYTFGFRNSIRNSMDEWQATAPANISYIADGLSCNSSLSAGLTVPSPKSFSAGEVTIAFRFRRNTSDNVTRYMFHSRNSGATANGCFGGALYGIYFYPVWKNSLSGQFSVTLGQWVNVVSVGQGNSLSTYLNGILQSTVTNTNSWTNVSQSAIFGAAPGLGSPCYSTDIAAIYVWDSAFSDGQRLRLEENFFGVLAPPPRTLYFDLAAGAATVVTPETAVLAAAGTIPKASLVLARGARALTWNGGAVQASGVLGPALATVLLYGQVPQASLSQQVPAAAGTVAGQDAKANLAIGPGAAAVSWVGQAVAVASGVLVEVGAAALTIVGNAVQASVAVAVSVGALIWRGLTVSTGGAQRLAGILGSMFRRLIGG